MLDSTHCVVYKVQNGFCCKSFLLLDIVKINGVMLSSGVCNGSEIVWMGLKILFEWGVVLVRSRKGFTKVNLTWFLQRKIMMEVKNYHCWLVLVYDRTAKKVVRPNPNGLAISTEDSAELRPKLRQNTGEKLKELMAKNCEILITK